MTPKPTQCKSKGCKRPYRAKGYCSVHYKKWRRGELGKARFKTCRNENCHKPMAKMGMCAEHFEAWLKTRQVAAATVTPQATPAAPPPAAEAPAS